MELYHRNTGAINSTPGLSLVGKLTFEHSKLKKNESGPGGRGICALHCGVCYYYAWVNYSQVLSESVYKSWWGRSPRNS